MTPKEIKAAESLLQSYQRHTDRRGMIEYYTGKINGLTEFLTDCGCTVTQDAAGIYMVIGNENHS